MIRVVRLEGLVVDERMGFERVIKISKWPVHEIAVQRPFKKGGENRRDHKRDRHRKEKDRHNQVRKTKGRQ
jgi:hypothetical protein